MQWTTTEPWLQSGDPLRKVFEATVGSTYGLKLWASHDDLETVAKLMAGSMMLCMLPPSGLDEALGEVHEVWQYHCDRVALGAPAPVVSKIGKATVSEKLERPLVLVVDD